MPETRPTHTLRRTFPRFGWWYEASANTGQVQRAVGHSRSPMYERARFLPMNLLGSSTSCSFATSAKRMMAA